MLPSRLTGSFSHQCTYLCHKLLWHTRNIPDAQLSQRDRAAGWQKWKIGTGRQRSTFNHCDIIALKICRIWWKTQNKSYYCVQGHSRQGCGLSLDVWVSIRTNVSSRSRLEKNCQRLGLGRQTSRSRLGVGHLRLVSKTNFGQIVQATLIKRVNFWAPRECFGPLGWKILTVPASSASSEWNFSRACVRHVHGCRRPICQNFYSWTVITSYSCTLVSIKYQ